ncbi:MAG: hypothetical protein AAF436_01835 [Myxococcota bacterium]
MSELRAQIEDSTLDLSTIEAHLDGLGAESRVAEIRSLGRKQQAKLFEAAAGHRPVSLRDLVPTSAPPMQEVVHFGKNTLPAFSTFAKVFARPDEESSERLWGYNRAGGFVETVVGPGYFVAREADDEGEVLVDYLEVPPAHPPGWPEILPNSARLSAFVYNGTQDILRGVSEHVTIGRAYKRGKALSAWFVLCRDASG